MRKHTFLFIIFLYVGTCIQVKATDQRGEYLVIGKDTLEMLTWPLGDSETLSKQIKNCISKRSFSTDCGRGYVGIWRLEADRLYLEKIIDHCGNEPYTYANIGSVFDGYKDKQGRIEASWFSGEMRTIKGKFLTYGEFGRIFEHETVYQLKNGVVTEKQTYHNMIKEASISGGHAICSILENFNGDLFPELADRKLYARIELLPHDNGKIDSLSISLRIDEGDLKTYEPDHPYVKELKRCLDLIPDWDVTHLYGKKEWRIIYENIWGGKGCKAGFTEHQIPYLVYLKDTLYAIREFPLQYDTRLYARLRPYVNKCFDYKCRRGYVATWELSDNRLFLKSIRRLNDKQPFPLERIFPDMKPGERIEATWYSGRPLLIYGEKLKKFREYYPIEIDSEIEKGKVLHMDVYRNYITPRDGRGYAACKKILEALDWNKDPELAGRRIVVDYTILPDMDGTIQQIQVELDTSGPAKGDQSRIVDDRITDPNHPYIKRCRDELSKVRWEVLYERKEIIPVKGSVHIQNMRGNVMDTYLEKQQ